MIPRGITQSNDIRADIQLKVIITENGVGRGTICAC